jgi:hypothetical protein
VQEIKKWHQAAMLFAAGSCLVWLGFLFPPFWLATLVLWALTALMLFLGAKILQCQDCNLAWDPRKPPTFPPATV